MSTSPYKLKLKDVKGELADGWIELLEPSRMTGYSDRKVEICTGKEGFLAKGTASWTPLYVVKKYDFSSPTLLKFLIRRGEDGIIKEGTIQEEYIKGKPLERKLTEVQISGINILFEDGKLVEAVTLDYLGHICKFGTHDFDVADKGK